MVPYLTAMQTPPATSQITSSQTCPSASSPGDGFTQSERYVETRAPEEDKSWVPQQEYTDMDIADLVPGPGCRTFMGRIVNFFDQPNSSKMPRAAKGCVKMVVKDDTGVISVLHDRCNAMLY